MSEYVKPLEQRLAAVQADSDDMARCLKLVEEWWLREGRHAFDGAPFCMFKVRELCAKIHFTKAEG